jgi:nitric oxide reductase large subunit
MKVLVLKVCNVALYLVTCILAGSGFLLEFRLEEDGDRILGLSGDDWSEIHLVIAFVFVGLSIAHLLLNWNWVVALFQGRKRRATVITALVGLALCVGILLLPAGGSGKHQEAGQTQGQSRDDD